VGGAFVIVTQAGSSGWLTLSPQTTSVSATGGTGEIAVTTSAPDFTWSFGMDVPWITDVECSCYLSVGPATLRYIVAANSGAERTGRIIAGDMVFTVTQQGGWRDARSVAWDQRAPQDAPSARLQTAMAPFGTSGQAILYGGVWDTTFSAETWLWDGSNWKLLHPANSPGLLSGHAMAYDAAHGQVVLFGGVDGMTYMFGNSTWVFDGNNWKQMQPAVSPPARFGHAMTYDAIAQKVVLFGGSGDYGDANDTWTWDGANWTQVVSSASPLPRSGHAMAFDAMRGATVLFGGFHLQDTTPTWYSDTWALDASGWHQIFSANPPVARSGHVLGYHPGLQSVVMIGGAGGKDVGDDGTWEYDFRREIWILSGDTWVQQFPENQPGPAYMMGVAYDNVAQGLTVHLGDDLTCDSRGPKTFVLKGPAAGSPAGVPVPPRR
jgi:hypothetical protein